MKTNSFFFLQLLVFSLVAAAFTNIYITQPVLPMLTREFGVSESTASLTISMVILGIVPANLFFGNLADRYTVKPIIFFGTVFILIGAVICFFSPTPEILIFGRFLQGLFIPSLTTCIAAYLSKNLPGDKLNVAMGSYVSATVVGGLGGRLIGGLLHRPEDWRNAFITASAILLASSLSAVIFLPKETKPFKKGDKSQGFLSLIKRPELFRIYLVSSSGFFVFSSSFNYMPFYLSGPPFYASTHTITFLYLSYLIGAAIGPLSGKLSNHIGNGKTITAGAFVVAASLLVSFMGTLWSVLISLCGVCLGFFSIHSAAAGALNMKLTESRGKANALYVLFYYLGGYVGITLSGLSYERYGWSGVVILGICILFIPVVVGVLETK